MPIDCSIELNIQVRIFALVHIKAFEKKDLEYFNTIFVDFWKKCIDKKETPIKSIGFSCMLCIDEETKELKKFLDICCVQPKKGRCILPAFVIRDYYNEYYSLNIGSNVVNKKCKEEYRKMQKELLEILGECEVNRK